ncbi:MAG TPA: TonB-dependent receptor [Steroidobacteraceae bacterium]|nr:TonB-dependent receptor [Steroidobacteraceae bacterium]
MVSKFRGLLAAVALGFLCAITSPVAQAQQSFHFDIPSQPLADALRAIGRQTDLNILFDPDSVRNRIVAPLHGDYTAAEAIDRVLRGTNLVGTRTDASSVVVRHVPAAKGRNVAAAPAPVADGTGSAAADSDPPADPGPPPPSAPASLPPDQLQEVLVTAEKVVEPAYRIPIAMSVLSGEGLKSQGIVNVSDLTNSVPSVIVGRDAFGVNINIRGVTTTDNTSKGEQGIGFYVDGIMLGRPLEEGLAMFDLDRVEILRGPQGTLYGQSTTGGVINIITNQPADRFETSGDMEFGNYDTVRADGMINLPVTDSIALRAAVNANRRDGYVKPDIDYQPSDAQDDPTARNDQDDRAGRLSALFKLGSQTRLLLTGTAASVGGVGWASVPIPNVLNNSGSAQLNAYASPFAPHIADNLAMVNAQLDSKLGPVALTWIGGHLHFSANDLTSYTYDPATNSDQYEWRDYFFRPAVTDSQELHIANSRPGPWQWLAGVNWYREDIQESDHRFNAPVSDPTLADSTNAINPANHTVHNSKGAFGQTSYTFADHLRATAGVRWSQDSLVRHGTFAAGPFGVNGLCPSPPPIQDCIGGPNNGSESANKVTYRLGLDYFATANQMIYGLVATGYKPGGFNDFDPVTHRVAPYLPESLTDFELGYKGRPSGVLEFDSNVYYYDYARDQITSVVDVDNNFVVYTRSVPTRIYGWENQLKWRVAAADTLDASFTAMHSRYVSLEAGIMQNISWAGYTLDKTPSATASLGYTHDWSLGDHGTLSGHADVFYSTSYVTSDYIVAVQYRQPAYTRTDLTLTYTDSSGRYYMQGFVRNLENKVQLLTAEGQGNDDAAVSEPRMFGVRLGFNY